MAKKTQETSITDDAIATGEAILKQIEDAGLGALPGMGTGWVQTMAALNAEIVSFVADRVRQDMQTQQKLLQCKNATDLQKVQMAFLEEAYSQYTAETGKLIKMSMEMLPGAKATTKHTPV